MTPFRVFNGSASWLPAEAWSPGQSPMGRGSRLQGESTIALPSSPVLPSPPPGAASPHAHILVVEDERDLAATLSYNLTRQGYRATAVHTGNDALKCFQKPPHPDLVILDLMLPDLSGIEVCRRIKSNPDSHHIPVLMLTAKGEEIDRVVGFEVGAEDYVVKPFSVRELMLRVGVILRRVHVGRHGQPEPLERVQFGELTIDMAAHCVHLKEEEIQLTPLEFDLLTTLYKHRGRVQTRPALLDLVWDIKGDVQTRTVDAHVKRLREKLGSAGVYIETVRGLGYRFRATQEPGDPHP